MSGILTSSRSSGQPQGKARRPNIERRPQTLPTGNFGVQYAAFHQVE